MNVRLLIALFFLFVSCHNDDPQPEAPVCMEDNSIEGMKKWYFFKPGSTWDYVEQNSGAVDHVWVNEYSEQISNGGYYIVASYRSDYYQRSRVFEHNGAWMDFLNNETLCKRRLIKHTFYSTESQFYYGPSNGNFLFLGDWRANGMLYSDNVGTSFEFDNVIRWVSHYYPLGGDIGLTEMYIAEGVGIVRIKQPGRNVDWILTNYHIEP